MGREPSSASNALKPNLSGFVLVDADAIKSTRQLDLQISVHNRRIAKAYEKTCSTEEAFVYAAMRRLMVRRLARAQALLDSLRAP